MTLRDSLTFTEMTSFLLVLIHFRPSEKKKKELDIRFLVFPQLFHGSKYLQIQAIDYTISLSSLALWAEPEKIM